MLIGYHRLAEVYHRLTDVYHRSGGFITVRRIYHRSGVITDSLPVTIDSQRVTTDSDDLPPIPMNSDRKFVCNKKREAIFGSSP